MLAVELQVRRDQLLRRVGDISPSPFPLRLDVQLLKRTDRVGVDRRADPVEQIDGVGRRVPRQPERTVDAGGQLADQQHGRVIFGVEHAAGNVGRAEPVGDPHVETLLQDDKDVLALGPDRAQRLGRRLVAREPLLGALGAPAARGAGHDPQVVVLDQRRLAGAPSGTGT